MAKISLEFDTDSLKEFFPKNYKITPYDVANFINASSTIYKTLVSERRKGRVIVTTNPKGKETKEYYFPSLEAHVIQQK